MFYTAAKTAPVQHEGIVITVLIAGAAVLYTAAKTAPLLHEGIVITVIIAGAAVWYCCQNCTGTA